MTISSKIAKELMRAGEKGKSVIVKMKGHKEIVSFMQKLEKAHKVAGKSKDIYRKPTSDVVNDSQ